MSEDDLRLQCLQMAVDMGAEEAAHAIAEAQALYEFVTNETAQNKIHMAMAQQMAANVYPGAAASYAQTGQQDQVRNPNAGPDIHWGTKTK